MTRHSLGQLLATKDWSIDRFRTGRMYHFGSLVFKIIVNNLVLFIFDVIISGIGMSFLPLISVSIMYSTISPIKEILTLWVFSIPLTLYLLSGYLLLPTKYIFTDFLSVILFGFIGLMIWVDCMNRPPSNVLNSPWWGYVFYTAGMGGVYDGFIGKFDPDYYWRILYSIVPMLFSFMGLEIKRYNK